MSTATGQKSAAPDSATVAGRRRSLGWLLFVPGLVWLLVFYVWPTVQLVGQSLYSGSYEFGYHVTGNVSNYTSGIADNLDLILRSFGYALVATLVCLVLGYPLAYAIALRARRFKNLMLILVIAPFFTSFLLRTLSWQAILADQGFVVDLLRTVHVLGPDGRLLATPVAVVCGLIYNFLPFMVLPLYASLDKLDPRLVEAAGDLYASPFTGFRKVTVPLSMPGVVSGTLLTFIPAAGDYINAQLLGSPQQYMIGNRIQAAFLNERDYPLAASLSIMLMALTLLLVVVYVRRAGTEELV